MQVKEKTPQQYAREALKKQKRSQSVILILKKYVEYYYSNETKKREKENIALYKVDDADEFGFHCIEYTVGGEPPGYFGDEKDDQRKF